ncbi:hypothetical protein NDU88_004286, partial [Pleurodeles waltl]
IRSQTGKPIRGQEEILWEFSQYYAELYGVPAKTSAAAITTFLSQINLQSISAAYREELMPRSQSKKSVRPLKT